MKRFVLYPILFVLSYFLSRVIYVKGQIDPTQVIRPLMVTLIATAIILVILARIFKSVHRAGFVFMLFTLIMFFYGPIYNSLAALTGTKSYSLSFMVLGILITLFLVGCISLIWKNISVPELITYYLNIVFIFMFLLQSVQASPAIWAVIRERWENGEQSQFGNNPPLNLTGDVHPDIYIIVLDAYARADVLESIYQYDNTKFLSALEKRGFYVAAHSHSNYVQTRQALSSLLNLDYIAPPEPSSDTFDYYHSMITNNRIFALLKQIGYETVVFDSGFPASSIPKADIYYSKFLPISEFESYLLWDTPAEMLLNVFGVEIPTYSYRTHRERVLFTFQMLQQIPEDPRPKIVFAHILSPHPPFIFERDGKWIEPNWPYQIWDAGNFQGQKTDYISGYRNQTEFISDQVLYTVDAILAKSKTPPIIILAGDHGPGSMFTGNLVTSGCLWERTANLNAVLLPDHISDPRLYRSISPVNDIRLIFNIYFNANLPLLADKTFLTSDSEPYLIKDITQEIETQQSCLP